MNKVELASVVSERMTTEERKVTKKFAGELVDCVMDVIKSAIVAGEDVKIAGLGAFTTVDRPERIARNPQDGSSITVPAHKSPKFKFSSSVKNELRA